MARLILKSPYLKCGGRNSVSGYLQYIGTRERVEILPDDRPPTRKQEQLVSKLTKDFPEAKELGEYLDYEAKPTKANASAFITRALEENWPAVQQSEGYMKYIATRPRAERLGDHGLFGDEDTVDLEQAMRELDQYNGNVWTHILSLKREDTARLGYDNAKVWRNLLRANRNDIAAAMNIPPNHFRWYAAYHDEGDHPHVHMMAWSTQPGEAYLTRDGIRKIKSQLSSQIFRQELLHTYEQKSQSRDELVREARRTIRKLTQEMARSICTEPAIEQKIAQLAEQLETVKGKKSYGYLPKSVKKTVDEVVDKLEDLPVVRACYARWCALQSEVESYYHDKTRERKKLSQEKEFRQIKNAVIQEAERIRLGEVTFEDADLSDHDEPEQVRGESYACRELRQIVRDDTLSLTDRDRAAEEMERLAEQGDPHAQYLLGQLYRDGPLLIPDSRKAKQFYTHLKQNGRLLRRELYGEGLSDQTVRGIHTTLHAALDKAVEEKLIFRNPADSCKLPPVKGREMKILSPEEIQRLLIQAREDGCYELLLLELATGLRRGEILALQWRDLNLRTGALRVERQVHRVKGELAVSPPKTKAGNRTVLLPAPVLNVLKTYKQAVHSRWMFPSPVKEDSPMDPAAVRKRLQTVLERAECKRLRFHDLRHTFATASLEHGMDIKTLSTIIGHVSSTTTLNTYTHVTDAMRQNAADKIDQGIGRAEPKPRQEAAPQKPAPSTFQAHKGQRRKPGTGCVSQINDHLWEGRYSPIFNGQRMARNVYAKTEAECEKKLAELIWEMKAEIAAGKEQAKQQKPAS